MPDFSRTDRRIAWWLVSLYPPAFRRDVGLGLVDALEDRMRGRRAAGASPLRSRLPAIADTFHNAPVEWVAVIRQVRLKPDTTCANHGDTSIASAIRLTSPAAGDHRASVAAGDHPTSVASGVSQIGRAHV